MILIGDSDERTDQDQASEGHLQPHFWRGPAVGHYEIDGLMKALAHQRRELRRLSGLALTLQLVKAGLAAWTLVEVVECIFPEIIGFQQIRNFKQKLFALHESTQIISPNMNQPK